VRSAWSLARLATSYMSAQPALRYRNGAVAFAMIAFEQQDFL
jgi:hypothetical protein